MGARGLEHHDFKAKNILLRPPTVTSDLRDPCVIDFEMMSPGPGTDDERKYDLLRYQLTNQCSFGAALVHSGEEIEEDDDGDY
jgi:hypothetical protein